MIVRPETVPDSPGRENVSSSQPVPPCTTSVPEPGPCGSGCSNTGTERCDQTFIVNELPAVTSVDSIASVAPPKTAPGNFCICPTWALVLMPLWSGLSTTDAAPPSKPPSGPKSYDAGSASKSTGSVVAGPPPPPGGTSVMSSK